MIGSNLWTSFCNVFLVSVLSLYFSAASCMNPDKNNLLYFNKQAVYMSYFWHPFVSPIMILPVLLNAWYRYLALKECDIVLFKLANEDNSTKGQPKVENMKEMAKKELFELC